MNKWLFIIILIAGLLLGLGHLTRGHDWGGDFAQYIMQAQGLVDGTVESFMESSRWTMEKSQVYPPISSVAYPWGLPLLLAPIYALMGINLTAFKMVGVISFVLFLAVFYRYVRSRHSTRAGLLLVTVFAVNPALLGFLNQIASDIPFLLVSTGAVLLILRSPKDSRGDTQSYGNGILAGALIGAACLLRTNGILLIVPLVASQFVSWLVSCRRSEGGRIHVRLLFTLQYATPWLVTAGILLFGMVLLPDGGSSHVGHLDFVTWTTIQTNVLYYIKLPLAFYEGVPGRLVICLFTFLLALTGALYRFKEEYPVILYILATLGVYLIWPDAMQGLRFLFPLLPFYLSFCLTGYVFLACRLPSTGFKAAIGAGSALLVYVAVMLSIASVSAMNTNHQNSRSPPEGPYTGVATTMFDDVRRLTNPEDHVVFFKPRVMRLMTGRPSSIQRDVKALAPGDYVVLYRDPDGLVWPMPEEALKAAVKSGMAGNVRQTERYAIYRMGP